MKLKKIYIYYIIILLLLLLFLIYNFIDNNYENFEDNNHFGFVITRHVKSEETNQIWLICIKQIRKYYPLQKIIIIDDNSNYEFVNNENIDLANCTVIQSEFKGRGELLPYYYYYHNKWFDRMIFIHDSVFINNKINISNVENVKFLWHFNGGEGVVEEENKNIEKILSYTNSDYVDNIISLFKSNHWKGCWGAMSVIDHNYLIKITNKYNLLKLIEHIKIRTDRMAFERIFGLICCFDNPKLINDADNVSIFGYYNNKANNRNSFTYNYNEYLEDINNNNMKVDINKLFFGR